MSEPGPASRAFERRRPFPVEHQRLSFVVIGLENPDYLPPPEPPGVANSFRPSIGEVLRVQLPIQFVLQGEVAAARGIYGFSIVGAAFVEICALAVCGGALFISPWGRRLRQRRKAAGYRMTAAEQIVGGLVLLSLAGLVVFTPALLGSA